MAMEGRQELGRKRDIAMRGGRIHRLAKRSSSRRRRHKGRISLPSRCDTLSRDTRIPARNISRFIFLSTSVFSLIHVYLYIPMPTWTFSPPSGTHLSSRRCYCVTTGIQRVSRCLYRAVPRGIPGKRDYFSQFAKQMLPLCSAPAVAGVCFPRTLPLFFFSSDLLSLIEPSSRRVDQDFFFPFFFSFFPSSFHLCTRRRSRHRRRRRARARVYSRIYTPAFPDRVAPHRF